MISYKIHLLRCGSVVEGTEGLYVGQLDLPLSQNGRANLIELAGAGGYPEIDRLYVSPLARCVQSAEILYPGQAVRVAEGLKDACLGEFEGKTFEELRERPEFVGWLQDSRSNPPPGGERVEDFTVRINAAFDGLVREMMRERVQSAAIITHGGVVMSLMAGIALPRLPLHQWAVGCGRGYTLSTSTQLWMQGGCAEAFTHLPELE